MSMEISEKKTFYQFLDERWFMCIRERKKIVEGRLKKNDEKSWIKKLRVGDMIVLKKFLPIKVWYQKKPSKSLSQRSWNTIVLLKCLIQMDLRMSCQVPKHMLRVLMFIGNGILRLMKKDWEFLVSSSNF